MIKLEKRLMPYCEECENLTPCTMKLRDKREDGGFDIKVVVMCTYADTCSHAVHQYQKTCENVPEIKSDPSPCKDCETLHKEVCKGCKAYFEWRGKVR